MENQNDQTVDATTEEQVVEETIIEENNAEREKPKLTPEQRRGILKRQLTKLNKELGIEEESPKKDNKSNEEPKKQDKTLDYGQLAYLEAKGISGDEEVEFLEKHCQKTGEELKDALKDPWVQSRIKTIKDKKTVEEATPTNAKRSGSGASAKDDVQYWINKKELPEDYNLRVKVVNERIRLEKSGNVFSSNPLVSGSHSVNK